MKFCKKFDFLRVVHDKEELAELRNNETGQVFRIPYRVYNERKQYFTTTLYLVLEVGDNK